MTKPHSTYHGNGWYVDYYEGREQPFTVRHREEVHYFTQFLEEADEYVRLHWKHAA